MHEFLKTAAGKLILGAIGVAVTLVWWTWRGNDHGDYERHSTLPARVLDGGGGTIKLKFEVNQPATLIASISTWDERTDEETGVEVEQSIRPGLHIKSVEVPRDAYVYFELNVPEATPGAEIDWNVYYDERPVYDEHMVLDEPLGDGHAFFAQSEVDSVAEISDWLAAR